MNSLFYAQCVNRLPTGQARKPHILLKKKAVEMELAPRFFSSASEPFTIQQGDGMAGA
jgi:hypothetical protein